LDDIDTRIVAPTVIQVNEMLQFLDMATATTSSTMAISETTGGTAARRASVTATAIATEVSEADTVSTNPFCSIGPNISDMDEDSKIRQLISRLVPYSQALKGSQTYIANERKKLFGMVCSPLITSEGTWRWFLTLSPADVYDSKIFDILIDDDLNDETSNFGIPYDVRHEKVRNG
jgi:hypothetical protein